MRKLKLFIYATVIGFSFCFAMEAAMAQDITRLPQPKKSGKVSLEEAIAHRRSDMEFSAEVLAPEQISQLLWAAQGETSGYKRAAPSAGALYPTELYLLTRDGFFHYIVKGHKLETVGTDDLRPVLSDAAMGQAAVKQAPAVFFIASVPDRIVPRYGERGMRYLYMEAGHIAQNLQLQAAALGLASVPVGSFDDQKVRDALSGLPAECYPVYIIPVGHKGSWADE